jgi:ABC-2 type transport system permease protein
MPTLAKITLTEARLFLREPMSVGFGVLFPTALLLVMGAIPALREPSAEYHGARFVDFWAPSALVMGLGVVALQHIPTVLATYRENGVLRRMSATPVHPAQLLLGQLLVALGAAVASAVLLIASARLVLDVPLPRHPLGFAAAFAVGVGSVLAIGALIAAVSPNSRVASGLATMAYLVAMFAGGVFLPRFLMPEALLRIGDYTPPGVQGLLDAWTANAATAVVVGGQAGPPRPLQLAIMTLVALAAGAAAARLFRWE